MRRLLIAILLLAVVSAVTFFVEQWNFFAPGPAAPKGKGTLVWIKRGQGSAQIAHQLQDSGVVQNALLFRLGVRLRGKNAALKAGEYAFPSRASMADVMGILAEGKSIQHKITVAEGLTSQMIFDIVQRDPALTAGDKPLAVPEEGALLPETYLFTRGTPRGDILARMRNAQRRLVAQLWPKRAAGLPLQGPEDAITLASIVEKETALPEERRHIAAVFINRLRLGMKLQSDPTTIYGITKGYPLGRGLRESELAAATPYNTYVIAGLPPTPICNPGKDSITAVLEPGSSNDLYFVANGAGGHVFSSSIAEHQQNVALWRQIEQAKTQAPAAASAPQSEQVLLRGSNDTAPSAQPPLATKPVVHRHRRHRRAR
ncbi:MAG: endolytic transglycosylase MltG [Alphaproteobacteria bacterium]|nr:endolytic transglycosylase MltG [Alphaproteobacteria bacterium]